MRSPNASSAAPAGREGKPSAKQIEKEIQQLQRLVEQFRIDAQRFLAGDLPLPPEELREKIQNELRRLRNSNLHGAANSFRIGSLEARLQSHAQLLGRRIRAQEMGEGNRQAAKEPPRPDPVKGVVVGKAIERTAAEALYSGLHHTKMDFDKFRTYLDRQAAAIRAKTGCEEIQFRVAVQEGKLKLKAKPIRR